MKSDVSLNSRFGHSTDATNRTYPLKWEMYVSTDAGVIAVLPSRFMRPWVGGRRDKHSANRWVCWSSSPGVKLRHSHATPLTSESDHSAVRNKNAV